MAGVNIEIRENGPLRVTGPITITDKDGKVLRVRWGAATISEIRKLLKS